MSKDIKARKEKAISQLEEIQKDIRKCCVKRICECLVDELNGKSETAIGLYFCKRRCRKKIFQRCLGGRGLSAEECNQITAMAEIINKM